jgi:hypothetical protein
MIEFDQANAFVCWWQIGVALACLAASAWWHGCDWKLVRVYCDLFAVSFTAQQACVLVIVYAPLDPTRVPYQTLSFFAVSILYAVCVACDLYLAFLRYKLLRELAHGPVPRWQVAATVVFAGAIMVMYMWSEADRAWSPIANASDSHEYRYYFTMSPLFLLWSQRGYCAYHVVYLFLVLDQIRFSMSRVSLAGTGGSLRRHMLRIGLRAGVQHAITITLALVLATKFFLVTSLASLTLFLNWNSYV